MSLKLTSPVQITLGLSTDTFVYWGVDVDAIGRFVHLRFIPALEGKVDRSSPHVQYVRLENMTVPPKPGPPPPPPVAPLVPEEEPQSLEQAEAFARAAYAFRLAMKQYEEGDLAAHKAVVDSYEHARASQDYDAWEADERSERVKAHEWFLKKTKLTGTVVP